MRVRITAFGGFRLLPTRSEERGVLGVGSIAVAILPLLHIFENIQRE